MIKRLKPENCPMPLPRRRRKAGGRTAAFAGRDFAGSGGWKEDGAQGRNRTTDTVIFSHVLYQLSYLGRMLVDQDAGL